MMKIKREVDRQCKERQETANKQAQRVLRQRQEAANKQAKKM